MMFASPHLTNWDYVNRRLNNLGEKQVFPCALLMPAPGSLQAVHRKIAGDCLSFKDYQAIARDIAANRYSKIEIAAFLVACTEIGLERDEVLHLTRAMIDTGKRLDLGGRQTLYWRNPRESHYHADCANRGRARHADT